MAFDIHRHVQKVGELLAAGTPFIVATLADIRGSAPQVQGARAIITADGIVDGTVGGGKVEARVIRRAQELLDNSDGRPCLLETWNLQTDVGMTCGGEVRFLFDVFLCHDWQVAVFGAGHIAQAMVPLLLNLNCRVTWLDQRADWLGRIADHPRLTRICTTELHREVANLNPRSFFVLMTQGHGTDLPVLAEILQTRQPPYLGVLGSQQKASILRRDLKALGLADDKIASYFCPMGLPIGNNTPPEIAISIVSQLIQERDRLKIINQKTKRF